MKLKFHPDITKDIKSSYQWYEEKSPGLGNEFINEIESGYDMLIQFPQSCPIIRQKYHKYTLPNFPFSIIYRIVGKVIYVVAVMHNSRKPGYWKNRDIENNR
jgi:plasmid stabilization system protein ParE